MLPGFDVDQRFVGAGLLGSFVTHDADVVRVAQHREERGTAHRPGRTLRRGHGGESTRGGLGEQADNGVIAGRVLLEHPPHQRGALDVDLDGAVLAALLVTLADVQVPDRRSHRGAAGLELLVQTLTDLGCEVLGVELRDGGHDAVQQHPRGSLVDVLRRRHQGHPGFDQTTVNLHIVQAVAGETVDLVDDAVGDLMRGDVLQHPLQVWSVSGAGGFSGVHELGDDACAEVFGLARVRLALGRDGEPFVTASLGRLLLGRDTLIRHRCQKR
nr:hypothetical protein [Flaviflexus equikiangi]